MPLNLKNFEKIHLDSVDSTNDYAKKLAASGNGQNAIIIAKEQTAGRTTKKDAPWFSPRGNLYFTMLLKLSPEDGRHFPRLSFLAAISVVETIAEMACGPADVKIKWPNDVLIDTKKACGILIEKEGAHAVIGIGINIASSPAAGSTAGAYPTTSLAEAGIAGGAGAAAEILSRRLIENINTCSQAGFAAIIEKVRPFMYRIGEQVFIAFSGQTLSGLFEGLADNGGIILAADGGKITLLSGEMTKENFL